MPDEEKIRKFGERIGSFITKPGLAENPFSSKKAVKTPEQKKQDKLKVDSVEAQGRLRKFLEFFGVKTPGSTPKK